MGILSAILQIIAKLLGLIPDQKQREISKSRSDWERNREAINTDLAPQPWWLRQHNDSGSKN